MNRLLTLILLTLAIGPSHSFLIRKNSKCDNTLCLHGTRRRQQRISEVVEGGKESVGNGGRGVQITGVTLPDEEK